MVAFPAVEECPLSLPAEIAIYFQPYIQTGVLQSKGMIIKGADMVRLLNYERFLEKCAHLPALKAFQSLGLSLWGCD